MLQLPVVLIAAAFAAQAPTGLDLFLLIGQSNMAGRGVIEEADREPASGICALNKEMAWAPAIDPIHFDKPFVGTGLGRAFARTLKQVNPAASIGLIPCAMGGSSLNEWMPGGKLYTDAVRRAREAMKSGRLRGILWHQGESDTVDESLARSYRERWTRFIEALRRDLNAADVPVMVGQLGEFAYKDRGGTMAFAPVVDEQLATLPLHVPHTAFVSSAGLGHKGDKVHFDSASLREFGRRYALAYMSLDSSWMR